MNIFYQENDLKIKAERFYKNRTVEEKLKNQKIITIRIIGAMKS